MTLKFSKGWQLNEKVVVDRSECLLIISGNPFHADYAKGRAPVLRGQITNWPRETAGSTWIKICGLFTSECVTSEIDQEGRFSFLNLTPAAYVIELLSASGSAVIDRIDVEDPGASINFDPRRPAGSRIALQTRTTKP